MVIGTRLNRPGVDATANNIIRSARATARFFPQIAPSHWILFSQILSIRNEGSHELETLNRRINERVALDPTDWGAKPAEREIIARLHQTKEAIPRSGVTIDATRPLEQVVDEILSKCREAD
jgi:hypothetical protein